MSIVKSGIRSYAGSGALKGSQVEKVYVFFSVLCIVQWTGMALSPEEIYRMFSTLMAKCEKDKVLRTILKQLAEMERDKIASLPDIYRNSQAGQQVGVLVQNIPYENMLMLLSFFCESYYVSCLRNFKSSK